MMDSDDEIVVLESRPVISFEVSNEGIQMIQQHIKTHRLIPSKWNQGGFDLVCLMQFQEGYMLMFIQITNESTHNLKLNFFSNLSQMMQKELMIEIERIEIIIAVPMENLSSFSMNQRSVTNSRALDLW
jgi:hypothetical protein